MSTHTQLLGEGAYARVYRHKNEAIKITPVKTEEDLTAIVREQYVLRMHLPNTVPFKNCYYKWNSMHISMEEADSNLNQWFKRQNNVDHSEIRRIVCQILQGIFSLHEHKVTHRDLKPDNVLMKGNKIWLCDFGLSRQFANDHCVPTGYMVTRWYRAPEIWKKKGYSEKVDLWSVGCILHKLLYGQVPGKSLKEIEERIPKLTSETELQTLLKGLLMMNPDERWSAKRALTFLKCKPIKTSNQEPYAHDLVRSKEREKWFYEFYSRFPTETRVLAHALMIFDKCDQEEYNMYCAMAIAGMLFKTRTSKLVHYALKRLHRLELNPIKTLAVFIPEVSTDAQRLSNWETFEGSFKEYVHKFVSRKRKK